MWLRRKTFVLTGFLKRICVLMLLSSLAIAQTGAPSPRTAPPGLDDQSRTDKRDGEATPLGDDDRVTAPGRSAERNSEDRPALSSRADVGRNLTAAPEPDIRFEGFVADSVGSKLPIFGQDLFQGETPTFTPLDQVAVPAEYVIGPGDELRVQVWGQIDGNYRVVVDRTGSVYLRTVGSLRVAGLRYDQLENYFRSAINQYYKDFEISVSLGKLRSIQVIVVGQVKRPGTYTISSLGTVVNALFASGGPKKRGSMRRVQLRRGGRLVATFDLYQLLTGGDESQSATLLSGDVIYVPPVGELVALAGSVNVPAIFELKDHTTLSDAIGYAGGLSNTAEVGQALIEHIVAHHSRKVEKLALDAEGLKRELHDGDVVRFSDISGKFDEAVTIRGNVVLPGRYPWSPGLRIGELIPNRDFLVTREFWRHQNKAQETQGDSFGRGNDGAGINQENLKNDVKRPSAEINWDYAVIERFDPQKLSTYLVSFNLGQAIDGVEAQNLKLEPGDVITIFSQADVQVPIDSQSKFVHLEGEFKGAGVYQAQPGETLRHLVVRSGGLTRNAYLYGAVFTRESTRQAQQSRLDQYIRTLEQNMERSAQRVGAATDSQKDRIEAQRRLLEKMKQLKATGRIVFRWKGEELSVNSIPDLVLEDEDRFVVPFQPANVMVIGSVYNENAFLYQPEGTVAYYLRAAGGVTADGDQGRAFVIRADGSTVARHKNAIAGDNFANMRLMGGDTVVVPEKLNRGATIQGLKDWTQILSQFALGAAATKVLLP
jgi:protein involved in polysaccharide export with SLBB domain